MVQQTMQSDLQNEFDYLIKEITKEVLELSVSKAMLDASHTVKNQIPKIDNYIIELNNVATKLSFIKNELEEQVNDVKDNYENFANQVENSTKKMKKLNEDVNKSRYEMEFIKQELLGNSEIFGELLKEFENQSLDNHKKIMNELKEVKSTLNEDRLLAKRRGKVQWMTLVSFLAVGILIYSQL